MTVKKILFACSTRKDLIKVSPLISKINSNETKLIAEVCYCGHDIDYQNFDEFGLGDFLFS